MKRTDFSKCSFIVILVLINAYSLTNAESGVFKDREGLISSWSFEGNVNDSKLINDGVINGDVVFSCGIRGRAIYLNGDNGFVTVPYNESFNFDPTGQFTICLWVNASARKTDYQALVVKGNNDTEPSDRWDWGVYLAPSGRFMAGLHSFHIVHSQTEAVLNRWYFLTVTYDAGIWTMYVNGRCEATGKAFITQSNGRLAIGRKGMCTGHTDFFNGKLDEVKIYNKVIGKNRIIQFSDNAVPIRPAPRITPTLHNADNNNSISLQKVYRLNGRKTSLNQRKPVGALFAPSPQGMIRKILFIR